MKQDQLWLINIILYAFTLIIGANLYLFPDLYNVFILFLFITGSHYIFYLINERRK